jgi:hypothetical protein
MPLARFLPAELGAGPGPANATGEEPRVYCPWDTIILSPMSMLGSSHWQDPSGATLSATPAILGLL